MRFPKVETMNNGDGRKTNAPQMVVEDGCSTGALALLFLLLINGVQGGWWWWCCCCRSPGLVVGEVEERVV